MGEDLCVNGQKAKRDRQTDGQTCRLPQWFLVLHFAAKNCTTGIITISPTDTELLACKEVYPLLAST